MAWKLSSHKGRIEHLRQLAIFGESQADWARGTIEHRPDPSPWNFYVGGRQSGKRRPFRRGPQPRVHWLDEILQEGLCKVCDVALRGISTPKPEHSPIANIRWACPKPSDPPIRILHEGQYAVVKQGIDPGFGDLMRIWMEKR